MPWCTSPGDVCAEGKGVCNASGSCECLDPDYQDFGDFRTSTGCLVYVPGFHVLWVLTAVFFAVNILLGPVVFVCMRRKKEVTRRFEKRTTIAFWFVSVFALWLSVLELLPVESGPKPRRIGIDVLSSYVFAAFNFLSYLTSLTKPLIRSETSIGRFVLERAGTKRVSYWYSRLAMVFALLIALASISPIVAAYHPHLQQDMIMMYGFTQAAVTFTLCIMFVVGGHAVLHDFSRAMSHPAVTQRSSLRTRVVAFKSRAKRTLLLAFIVIVAICLSTFTVAVCYPCSFIIWFILPSLMIAQGVWIARTYVVSIQTSWQYRVLDEQQRKSLKMRLSSNNNMSGESKRRIGADPHSANGQDPDACDGDDETGTSQHMTGSDKTHPNTHNNNNNNGSFQSHSSSSKNIQQQASGNKKKSAASKNKKKAFFMSAVAEVEYEGTVILTNIEGLRSVYQQSRIDQEDTAVVASLVLAGSSSRTLRKQDSNTLVVREEDEEEDDEGGETPPSAAAAAALVQKFGV